MSTDVDSGRRVALPIMVDGFGRFGRVDRLDSSRVLRLPFLECLCVGQFGTNLSHVGQICPTWDKFGLDFLY